MKSVRLLQPSSQCSPQILTYCLLTTCRAITCEILDIKKSSHQFFQINVCSVCQCGPSRDVKRSFPGARRALCCHQARWVTCIVILKSQNIPMWLIWGNWGSEELGSSSKVTWDMAGSELEPRSTLESPCGIPLSFFSYEIGSRTFFPGALLDVLWGKRDFCWASGHVAIRGCVARSFPSLIISFPLAASVFPGNWRWLRARRSS